MDTKTFAQHGLLAVVLALGGAVGCGDDTNDDATAGADNNGGNNSDNAGNNGDESDAGGEDSGPKDIVDTAVANGSFTVLADALGKADLIDALKGDGPFTVFAPTDAAFAKLPKGTLDSLTKEQLTAILTYHVVAAKVPASAVKAGPVKMLSGISAFLATEGGVSINGAKVTTADVEATNGVIHVIDTVLLPPNLVEAAGLAGGFSTLVGAVTKAGLGDALSKADANLTVFAPTDAAFAALPMGTLSSLSVADLTKILTYHVVASKVLSTDLTASQVTTLNGKAVSVSLSGGVKINDANVVIADIVTTNGIIHVIDKVLLP